MKRNCTDTVPYLTELFADLGSVGLGLVISTGIATLIMLIRSLLTFRLVYRNSKDHKELILCLCLVGICPIVGVTSFIGIISPRSVYVDELVSAIYVSGSVAVLFRLMMLYHGGAEDLCEKMKGMKMPFSKPPCCCCLCLRHIYVNRRTVQVLKLMVYQVLVARPVLLYLDSVLKSEEKTPSFSLTSNPLKTIVSMSTNVSTVCALFGLLVAFRLSREPLRAYGIGFKFLHLKLALMFCDPQRMIVSLLAMSVLPCSDLLYHPARAYTLQYVLLCFEMSMLSWLWFYQYSKHQKTSDMTDPTLNTYGQMDTPENYESINTSGTQHGADNRDNKLNPIV